MSPPRLSRRELALVAAALLLPVPLIAESGLSLPVPGAVERGFGSQIALEAYRERLGTATGSLSEGATGRSRSVTASLSIARTTHRSTRSRAVSHDHGMGTFSRSASGHAGNDTSEVETPKGGGDTNDTGSSADHGGTHAPTSPGGTDAQGDGPGTAPQVEPKRMPSVDLHAAGQGTASGASVNADGVDTGIGGDSGGDAGDDETAGVQVDVTDAGGSQTGMSVAVR